MIKQICALNMHTKRLQRQVHLLDFWRVNAEAYTTNFVTLTELGLDTNLQSFPKHIHDAMRTKFVLTSQLIMK